MTNRVPLLALLTCEAAVVVGLHALGSAEWAQIPTSSAAFAATSDLDLVMALMRLATLALTLWCFVTTVLAVVVHARSTTPIARTRALGLVPSFLRTHVRRGVAGLVVGGVLLGQGAAVAAPLPPGLDASSLTQPAPAEQAEPEPELDDLMPPGLVAVPADSVLQNAAPSGHDSWPAATGDDLLLPPVPPMAPDPERRRSPKPEPGTHTVQPGEHLWSIARTQLADAGAPIDDVAVADHWRRLVDANLPTLPGGDPDVVQPGHVVTLVEVAS